MIKTIVFLSFVIGFTQVLNAQNKTIPNSFVIVNNKNPEQAEFYKKSIEAANMESYRLQNKDVTVHFENGFDCVFTSAKGLFLQGKRLNATSYQENFAEDFELPAFNIIPSGHLIAIYPLKDKKFK